MLNLFQQNMNLLCSPIAAQMPHAELGPTGHTRHELNVSHTSPTLPASQRFSCELRKRAVCMLVGSRMRVVRPTATVPMPSIMNSLHAHGHKHMFTLEGHEKCSVVRKRRLES